MSLNVWPLSFGLKCFMHYIACAIDLLWFISSVRKWFCSANLAMEKRLVNYYPFVWHTMYTHTHTHMYTYTHKNTCIPTHTHQHTHRPHRISFPKDTAYTASCPEHFHDNWCAECTPSALPETREVKITKHQVCRWHYPITYTEVKIRITVVCTLNGQTRGVLGKHRHLRCGQPLSVDLDQKVFEFLEDERSEDRLV